MYILGEAGLYTKKANRFGWSTFTTVRVGYYNNALKDTKLVERREAFYRDNKLSR